MKHIAIFALLLFLLSCNKKTLTDQTPSQPEQNVFSGMPRKIVVTNSSGFVQRPVVEYSLLFDSSKRVFELNELLEPSSGDSKKTRLRNEYNADGYLIKQTSLQWGYSEPTIAVIERKENNEIRRILSSFSNEPFTDTLYYTYNSTNAGMDIITVLSPDPALEPPMQNTTQA